MADFTTTVAWVCLIWVIAVILVQALGIRAIFRNTKKPAAPPVSPQLGHNAPHVTIIRPVKGVEPQLYECIASAFRQNYPRDRLSIRLCVDEASDPAYPVLNQIVQDFPDFDAQVLVEAEDPRLNGLGDHIENMGPNPKVRNLSRAYREAKGEVVWIVDCNVWMSKGVMGRMVDKLMGFGVGGASAHPYKFVHQLPIVVDLVDYSAPTQEDHQSLLWPTSEEGVTSSEGTLAQVRAHGGGRLDEMFMATTHAKFYSAINASLLAPCAVGKSNMFRKTQLDQITNPVENPILPKGQNLPIGTDFFSHNICEDHLIGELFWRSKIPGYRNHGLVWGDLAVQPMSGMSVKAYAARRARWLRARKYTVIPATLVEPGIESFLCCAYAAFAATTLPFFEEKLGIPPTWRAFGLVWLACVAFWVMVDWFVFRRLHSGATVESDPDTPFFAKGSSSPAGIPARSFLEFFPAWLGREGLALPIWTFAVLCGNTVNWRGKIFHVNWDTTVVDLTLEPRHRGTRTPEIERASSRNKRRVE